MPGTAKAQTGRNNGCTKKDLTAKNTKDAERSRFLCPASLRKLSTCSFLQAQDRVLLEEPPFITLWTHPAVATRNYFDNRFVKDIEKDGAFRELRNR
jgi:hypothetical protein